MMTKLMQLTVENKCNYSGKSYDEVGERQKRRKLMAIKEASKKALWFLDSFNLDLLSIVLKPRSSNDTINLMLSSSFRNDCTLVPSNLHKKVDEILFLLDSYGISDEFYHELSMVHPSLPRSYLIKERRTNISSNVASYRLPKPYFGCYRPLKDCIIDTLSFKVSSNNNFTK